MEASTAAAERRESPRVPIRLGARLPGQAHFEAFEGDVSLGGARVDLEHPPFGNEMEIALPIPGEPVPLRVLADVLRVTGGGLTWRAHLRFREIPLRIEMAIARYLDRTR
jgi:hypothetical protein